MAGIGGATGLARSIPAGVSNLESSCIGLMLFGINTLITCLFFVACVRYEWSFFLHSFLAVVGILSLERALTGQPVWRRAMRWTWSLLLIFSVAFNLLAGMLRWADADYGSGRALQRDGLVQQAIERYERALQINPDYAELTTIWGSF